MKELYGYRGRVALYQPENPENVGSIIRICDCFEFDLHIISPIGFPFDSPMIKAKKLDYNTSITVHDSFSDFLSYVKESNSNIVLFTPHTENTVENITFTQQDILLFGRESSGVPDNIAGLCHNMVKFQISPRSRSLNLAISVGIALHAFGLFRI